MAVLEETSPHNARRWEKEIFDDEKISVQPTQRQTLNDDGSNNRSRDMALQA